MNYTKRVRFNLWFCRILDYIFLFAPLCVYFFIAILDDNVANMRKFALTGITALACIIVIINLFLQKKKTSFRWLIILGLYICISDYLMPLIITLAIVSLVDDFIMTPLINHFRMELVASKTYDKRKEYEEKR